MNSRGILKKFCGKYKFRFSNVNFNQIIMQIENWKYFPKSNKDSTLPIQARTRNLSSGENVQKWTRYFLLFFLTRPSDEYDSAPSRKYSRPLLTFSAVSLKFVSLGPGVGMNRNFLATRYSAVPRIPKYGSCRPLVRAITGQINSVLYTILCNIISQILCCYPCIKTKLVRLGYIFCII